jgi:hypothetical protein
MTGHLQMRARIGVRDRFGALVGLPAPLGTPVEVDER